MPLDKPIQVVLKFEEMINSRNAESIATLMTADAEFVDSLGHRIQGTEKLRSAWAGYFKMVPDYSISHSEIFADGATVAMFGSAQGTFTKGEAGSRAEHADAGAGTTGQMEHSLTGRSATKTKENFWRTPAAWRAVVKGGKIALWQVYADNEPIRAIMRKAAFSNQHSAKAGQPQMNANKRT
jgi:ketosteroid isomerase-like protein